MPAEVEFDSVTKSKMKTTKAPSWWRASFDTPEVKVALSLDLSGLTKGQVYLNDQALGRYVVETNDGKAVEPTMPLVIPCSLLRDDEENELTIFDEYGAAPSKVKVIVERL